MAAAFKQKSGDSLAREDDILDLMDIELDRDLNGYDRIMLTATFTTKEQRSSKETKYQSEKRHSFKSKDNLPPPKDSNSRLLDEDK